MVVVVVVEEEEEEEKEGEEEEEKGRRAGAEAAAAGVAAVGEEEESCSVILWSRSRFPACSLRSIPLASPPPPDAALFPRLVPLFLRLVNPKGSPLLT